MFKNQIKKRIIFISLSIMICKKKWLLLIIKMIIMNIVNNWIKLLTDLMFVIESTRTKVREKWICYNNNH